MSDKPKLTEAQRATLQKIQKSVPDEWYGRLIVERQSFATVREVARLAVDDPEVSDEVKDKARMLLDSGLLDKTERDAEPVVAELVDAYIAKEILKAVIAKRLPKPPHAPNFKEAYARYQTAKANYDDHFKEA